LICQHGGYQIFRHNKLRDVNAELLKQVCYNVETEPVLMPITAEEFHVKGKNEDGARLDISACGLWGPFQKTFFDVRVFHPNAPTYKDKEMAKLYVAQENEKCRAYKQRVLQTEKATFTPLIYSTNGGMAEQGKKYHKKLATMIAHKTNESYSDVMRVTRTKIAFALLKSVLVSIRGVRGNKKKKNRNETPLSCLDFNLVPT